MCHHISIAVRRNQVSAHVPSHFKRSKTKSGFCACAITFQTQLDEIWFLRMCHHISNAVRRNLVYAHVPSHFKRSKTKSGFCACAITFQTQFTTYCCSEHTATRLAIPDLKSKLSEPNELPSCTNKASFAACISYTIRAHSNYRQ